MTSLVIRPEAEADVSEAYSWYEGRSTGLGGDVRRARLKRFPYGVYFIFENPSQAVIVIGCIHVRQDPRRVLRRIR